MKQKSILAYYLLAIFFLFPLFFFPFLRDAFILGKNYFLVLAALLGLAIWAVELFKSGKFIIRVSFLTALFFLLSLFLTAYLFFLESGNRYEAIFGQPATGTVLALAIIYFLATQALRLGGQAPTEEKPSFFIKILGFSAGLLALSNIILFIIPASAFPLTVGGQNSPLVIGSPLWSPFGSVLESLWLLVPVFVYLVTALVQKVNKEGRLQDLVGFGLSVVLLVGIIAGVYQLIQTDFALLDFRTTWSIVAESFKRSPFFGVGPGRFSEAFTLFKSASFNSSVWWNTRFARASGWYWQWWTETGLIGLTFLAWIILILNKKVKALSLNVRLSWAVLIIMPLFIPSGLGFLFMLFFFASILKERKDTRLPAPERSDGGQVILPAEIERAGILTILGVVGVMVLASGYFVYRYFTGEYLFYKFVRGIAGGTAQDNDYYQAVNRNPYVASFRMFRSQVDMSVLNSILTQAADSETQLAQDQQDQLGLISQEAINEAKAAAALQPQSAIAWENLAVTYRQLINLAQGADQWTVAAYQQAVAIDPANPRLRVDFGGVYYGLGDYETAARQFELAVSLKGDYPNAWYNYAWSLKQQNKLQGSVQALQQSLTLVTADTPDYQQGQELLQEWQKELDAALAQAAAQQQQQQEQQQPTELVPPQPLPSPQIEEPIELPQEAAPEIEITPTPEEQQAE
ncbi:MAG: hypothetical protein ABIB61_00670 [Candidatus Shapirobacteria bacterium]